MDYRTKHRIAIAVLVLGMGMAFYGFNRVQGEAFSGHVSPFAFGILFGGAIIGVSAEVCRHYFRRRLNSDDSQKVALMALSEIGRQNIDKKSKKKTN